jgi:hypothetical protein
MRYCGAPASCTPDRNHENQRACRENARGDVGGIGDVVDEADATFARMCVCRDRDENTTDQRCEISHCLSFFPFFAFCAF